MNTITKISLSIAGLALAAQAGAQVTFYEHDAYQGRSFTTVRTVENFARFGFNDRASSAVVAGNRGDRWEVCEDRRFRGRCVVLRPGQYGSLAAMGLNDRVSSVRAVGRNARVSDDRYAPMPAPMPPPVALSQVVFYENDGFQGRTFSANTPVNDLRRAGFNDRASSAVVSGSRWEVCDNTEFGGSCRILRPGQYPSLSAMGLNDRISSVRAVGPNARFDEPRYAPLPAVSRDYGRRNNERLYEANITSVRAVVEDSGQRCWVEREQVVQEQRSGANVPGALLGAVIGGILGHQVGGGTGKDVATGIGVVAGAAIGGNAGRDNNQQVVTTQNVQRCSRAPGQARPAYWDVTYNFRGQDYHVQMTSPPSGSHVTVNDQGEPRA
ncbi:MAG: peptidase inhibitor family I36 protein [Burkholderiaceae bacterium]|nr:peptidase inhibitor family I36 protein [Burkholderiaceae bacterium]